MPHAKLTDEERRRSKERKRIQGRDRMRTLRSDPAWLAAYNAQRRANRRPRTEKELAQHRENERRRRANPNNVASIRESRKRCKAKPSVKQKARETERKRAALDNAKSRARYATDADYRAVFRRRRDRCYATNPAYRLRCCLRASVRQQLKLAKVAKTDRTMSLLGCTLSELISHLESLFLPGMNWDNYGIFGWHIDHIIPCASFNLADPEQRLACFHWSNLQPLWAADNLRKSDVLPDGTRGRSKRSSL